MKLFSQFEQVERATPFARRDDGKISTGKDSSIGNLGQLDAGSHLPEGTAQGTGPHVAPKLSM